MPKNARCAGDNPGNLVNLVNPDSENEKTLTSHLKLCYTLITMQNALDQFYTKKEIAAACWKHFTEIFTVDNLFFVEPSAGTGAFYNLLPPQRRLGMDIEPKCEGVIAQDFFKVTGFPMPLSVSATDVATTETAIIGNPPFGKRGKLAIAFFNHAAYLADTVAFIVPVNFRKWTVHKQLDSSMRFISKLALPREAFQLGNGKPYAVNTEFQIWTRGEANAYPDMRLHQPLPIAHPDFQMWQYNNTPTALKVFRNDFDFAVPCQGWQDYSRKETDEKQCERNKQWLLLKAKNPHVLARLMRINYERLAQESATAVPGFRKGDLVQAYRKQETSPRTP